MKKKQEKVARKLSKKELEAKRIKHENARFEKLSAANKRVTIAKDVLAQLKTKRLIAQNHCWLDIDFDYNDDEYIDRDHTSPVEEITRGNTCTVCGIGALFVCAVERSNKLTLSDLGMTEALDLGGIQFSALSKYLKRFFEQSQLKLIEAAFERGRGEIISKGIGAKFAIEIEEDSERLRLIMENIIVNQGTFVPSQKPITEWRPEVLAIRNKEELLSLLYDDDSVIFKYTTPGYSR